MLTDLAFRMRALLRRGHVERDLDAELRFHVEGLTARYVAEGMPPAAAVRRARMEFGGVDLAKEECRDAFGIRLVDQLFRDLRLAVRQWRRAPLFAIMGVLCLGLGIGVNTSIFSMLNAMLFRYLPVDNPSAVVVLTRGDASTFPFPLYSDFRANATSFAGLAAVSLGQSDIDIDGQAAFTVAEAATTNYAEVIGLELAMGRWFQHDDEPVAVISDVVWSREFNRSPSALGAIVRSEAQVYTIVGVMPPAFQGVFFPHRTDLWVPLRTRPTLASNLENWRRAPAMILGRIADGATVTGAALELNRIDERVRPVGNDDGRPREGITVAPLRGMGDPGGRTMLTMVAGILVIVSGLVLGIVCLNVGNLLLIRGSMRHRELAMRRALGAGRWRIIQQLLTETLLLALVGGVCGVLFAAWTNRVIQGLLPRLSTIPVDLNLSINGGVVAFALSTAVVAMLVCGLRPAWLGSNASLLNVKGEISAIATRARRSVPIVAQVTMSLLLLLLAGVFLQAILKIRATDPGFASERRLLARTIVPGARTTPEIGRRFYDDAVAQLQTLPGVRRVTLTDVMPLEFPGRECVTRLDGSSLEVATAGVAPAFFSTLQIDMVAGTDFVKSEPGDGIPAVIVNEQLAQQIAPGRSPVSERVEVGCNTRRTATIVGVVRNASVRAIGESDRPFLYVPFGDRYRGNMVNVVVETDGDEAVLVEPVRRWLNDLGGDVRVYGVMPLESYVDESYWLIRWEARVLSVIGGLALALSAIGLYGVIAYRVSQRTREIGVQMALGAKRSAIFRGVLRWGAVIVVTGVVIGEVLTLLASRFITTMQPGTEMPTWPTHAAMIAVWVSVALVACSMPALRAMRIDPMTALREE